MKKRLFVRLLWFALGAVLLLAIWVLYSWGVLGGAPSRRKQLFTEVWNGDTNEVARLLKAGVGPNIHSIMLSRATPLTDAVKFGHLGVIELLLEHGADPNMVDVEGHAALYQALTSPYLGGDEDHVSDRIVELLLAHGAAIDGRGVVLALKNLPESDPRLIKCKAIPARQVPKAEVR